MTPLWTILGALGGAVLVAVGADMVADVFDRLFRHRADLARLVAMWGLVGTFGVASLIVGVVTASHDATRALLMLCGFVALVVCLTQSWGYRATHERRPRAHDPRRTDPRR